MDFGWTAADCWRSQSHRYAPPIKTPINCASQENCTKKLWTPTRNKRWSYATLPKGHRDISVCPLRFLLRKLFGIADVIHPIINNKPTTVCAEQNFSSPIADRAVRSNHQVGRERVRPAWLELPRDDAWRKPPGVWRFPPLDLCGKSRNGVRFGFWDAGNS